MRYRIPATEAAERARRVTHLLLDCDGVMTDGTILLMPDGEEIKRFNTLDGHGIVLWRRAGRRAGVISGRGSRSLETRVEQLGMEYLVQRTHDKLASFRALVAEHEIAPEAICYVGDDVVDIPIMLRVGLGVATADAVDEVIESAHAVTVRRGGEGAVREVVDALLKAQGLWEGLMERYRAPDV